MGMEITNDTIQIFGGYGYTKDQGIEQLFRDNRITPIYEGTNSVQAIDLVYRKILNNKILEEYISQIDEEIKNCKSNKNLDLFRKDSKIQRNLNKFYILVKNKQTISKDDISSA